MGAPGITKHQVNHLSWLNSFKLVSSYVKWLEAAGAQVVPVIISIDDDEDLTEYFQEVILVLYALTSNFFGVNWLFFII